VGLPDFLRLYIERVLKMAEDDEDHLGVEVVGNAGETALMQVSTGGNTCTTQAVQVSEAHQRSFSGRLPEIQSLIEREECVRDVPCVSPCTSVKTLSHPTACAAQCILCSPGCLLSHMLCPLPPPPPLLPPPHNPHKPSHSRHAATAGSSAARSSSRRALTLTSPSQSRRPCQVRGPSAVGGRRSVAAKSTG
jgi:hypothetical protein